MGKVIEYYLDQKTVEFNLQKEYMNKLLDGVDDIYKHKTRLKNNIHLKCKCGTSTFLGSYFQHCKSKKHLKYIHDNNISIYCIIDSNFDINI
jgi:hypothetical protein